VQAFKGDAGLFAQQTLYEKLAPRFQSLTVNSADSPLMKMFEPTRFPNSSPVRTSETKSPTAENSVAQEKGGQ
jgi:hypothetical protein